MSVFHLLVHGLLGCAAESPRTTSLDYQRRVLRVAEEAFLWRQATRALAEGDGEAAARAVAMGLEVAPARFGGLIDQLSEQVGPTALAEVLEPIDPDRAGALLEEGRRSAAIARYREGGVPPSLVGVTRSLGHVVLEGARAEFVHAPDEEAMRGGALTRLRWAAEALNVEPPGPHGAVDALIDAAVAKGIPEPVAVHEAVTGALHALDAYTRPVWPAQIDAWTQHHEGVTLGIGVELRASADRLLVHDLVVDGPAWTAGVHQGDQLSSIDGALVQDRESAESALAGAPGTTVVLGLQRADADLELPVTRAAVPEVTVRGWRRTPTNHWTLSPPAYPGTAVVRISAFRPTTDEAFDALVGESRPNRVILDLRGNAGGDVMAAANIADRFISDGIVADLQGRTINPPPLADGEVAWNTALPGDGLEGVPVVVLIDRDTASAAELLAGALRERVNALLIGEPTVGKSGSQALRTHPSEPVAWQVTTGVWTLPSGTSLTGGLAPDIPVRLSPAERFQASVLRNQREYPVTHADGTPMEYPGPTGRPELPGLSADPLLAVALRSRR